MTTVATIDTAEGTITLNSDDMKDSNKESIRILSEIAALQEEFKEHVEAVAEKIGMKKGKLTKYFKARFNAQTKALTEQGEVFGKIDELLDGKNKT